MTFKPALQDYLDMAMHTGHADKCGTVLLLIMVVRPQATFQYPGIFPFYNHSLAPADQRAHRQFRKYSLSGTSNEGIVAQAPTPLVDYLLNKI